MTPITYIEAIRQALWEEMEQDERVFMIGQDIGTYGGAFRATAGMLERFGPQRIIDSPISESAMVGTAIGAAMMGLRPIVEMHEMKLQSFDRWEVIVRVNGKIVLSGNNATVLGDPDLAADVIAQFVAVCEAMARDAETGDRQ